MKLETDTTSSPLQRHPDAPTSPSNRETRAIPLPGGIATSTESEPHAVEQEHTDPGEDTMLQSHDVAAVGRLLSQRRFKRRQGLMAWAWMLASPFGALTLLWNLASGNLPWALGSVFVLMTAWTLCRQANRLSLETAAFAAYEEVGIARVGALIEALTWSDPRVRMIARRCLTRRLPTLTPNDADRLSPEQRAGLYRYLNFRTAVTDPEFVQAILTSLPVVGDRRAMPAVERLLRLKGLTRRLRQVRATALSSVGLLEQRVERDLRVASPQASPTSAVTEAGATPAETETPRIETTNALSGFHEPDAPTAHEHEEAATRITSAVPDSVEAQWRAFEEETRQVQSPGMRVGYLIASWCIIVPYCAFKSITSYQAGAWPATVLFAVAALAATQLHRFTLSARHRRLAQRLAEIDDIHGVGRLAEALAWPDSEVRDLVAEALTRLLPRLKASDASLLNASQRTSLYQMLDLSNATTYAEFLVALLGALQQIGDRNAVPAVERLAASEPITTRQARVKQAAIECLPYLHQAAEQNQYSQTLLRASSSSNTSSDLLLRSVTTSAVNDEAQLLRAEP